MSGNVIAAGAVLLIAAVAFGAGTPSSGGPDARTRLDLESVARRSVLFAHQSVGMNVLAGIRELSEREGVPLHIVDVSTTPVVAPRTFAHLFVGQNGSPTTKLDGFTRALEALPPDAPDIALVKFCYVDFAPATDAAALFARYRSTVADLQARRPGTRFVHVTAPLSTVQSGPRAWVKRLLGKAPYGLVENVRREEFNALLRNAYGGKEPVFDLALVESTLPDGTRSTVPVNGGTVPVLASSYTDDGGHLNEAGRLRAARELLSVLAAVSRR